jgi:hypothetical protein
MHAQLCFQAITQLPCVSDAACTQVIMQLKGGLPLPWEGAAGAPVRAKLGLFCGPVLQLLQRDAERRASLRHFYNLCADAIGEPRDNNA